MFLSNLAVNTCTYYKLRVHSHWGISRKIEIDNCVHDCNFFYGVNRNHNKGIRTHFWTFPILQFERIEIVHAIAIVQLIADVNSTLGSIHNERLRKGSFYLMSAVLGKLPILKFGSCDIKCALAIAHCERVFMVYSHETNLNPTQKIFSM